MSEDIIRIQKISEVSRLRLMSEPALQRHKWKLSEVMTQISTKKIGFSKTSSKLEITITNRITKKQPDGKNFQKKEHKIK